MAAEGSPASFPPLPTEGTEDDLQLAQQNYEQRERASRSWRVFSRTDANVFKRRSLDLLPSDSESETSSRHSFKKKATASSALDGRHNIARSRSVLTRASTAQDELSEVTGRIIIGDFGDENVINQDEHLYRWVEIFENQRGISVFSTARYSSQSLLPKDPPAFTIASNDSYDKYYANGTSKRTKRNDRSNITLDDFPLPDGNWRWASKEWMVDMRDEHVQYDGFQYNWYFRKAKWRNKPGRLNAGAWVRRRRWIRLMERPPLALLEEDEDARASLRISDATPMSDEVWKNDGNDWVRLHDFMRNLSHDGKRLEAWRHWVGDVTSSDDRRTVVTSILRDHKEDILRFFIFPTSRIKFLSLATKVDLISRDDSFALADALPSLVDRTELVKALFA